MDISRVYGIASDWFCRTRVDLHVAPSNGLENRSRIERRLFERSIAMNGGDAQQFDARIVRTE